MAEMRIYVSLQLRFLYLLGWEVDFEAIGEHLQGNQLFS